MLLCIFCACINFADTVSYLRSLSLQVKRNVTSGVTVADCSVGKKTFLVLLH
jgi:hypothetical protein